MKRIINAAARPARLIACGVAIAMIGLASGPGAARADFFINTDATQTITGGANATTAQGATVNAQVLVHFDSNGNMTVTLTNLLGTAASVGQAITGIAIYTQPSISVSSPLLNTYGQLYSVDIAGNLFVETGATGLGTGPNQGQFVGGSATAGTGISYFDNGSGFGHNKVAASNWNVISNSPGIISVLGTGQPTQSVISAAGAGSGFFGIQHLPVFDNSVSVVAGTTGNPSTTVTGVKFYFGTGTDSLTLTVPAPGGMPLALAGFAILSLACLRRLLGRSPLVCAGQRS